MKLTLAILAYIATPFAYLGGLVILTPLSLAINTYTHLLNIWRDTRDDMVGFHRSYWQVVRKGRK